MSVTHTARPSGGVTLKKRKAVIARARGIERRFREDLMSDFPQGTQSHSELGRQAATGGIALGAGLALLVFKGISAIPVFGQILGVGLVIAGLVLRRKRGQNHLPSIGLMVLGGLAVATIIPGVRGLAAFVLTVSAIGLLGFGTWKLWGYFRGLRSKGQEAPVS